MSEISPDTIDAAASVDESRLREAVGNYKHGWDTNQDEWVVVAASEVLLARLAADRAEREERARPIDAEWLESIGCKKMAINRWKIQEQIRVNVWLVECVRWMVRIDGWLVQMHTRGQLLDLLRVLKGGDA